MALTRPKDDTERMRICPHCTLPMKKIDDTSPAAGHWQCTNDGCPAPTKPHVEPDTAS